MIKPSKALTKKAAIALAPEYVELLRDFQKRDGRIAFSSELSAVHSCVGSYVRLYEDERRIGVALFLALLGEEGFAAWNKEVEAASETEQQAWLDEIISEDEADIQSLFDGFNLPTTAEEWATAKEAFNGLSESERAEATKQASFFWSFFFSSFFNTLSLMVHGVKLTTLVPQAISGDLDAFLKAVQIDRMLLLHHPYFRDRKRDAQDRGETEFLRRLLTREVGPSLQSRIRYPGLYMLFGILDALQWLGDMRHEEILDIVDAAGLDRYQNRVEDVNYLTKRLLEYRRWQKLGVLSMQ